MKYTVELDVGATIFDSIDIEDAKKIALVVIETGEGKTPFFVTLEEILEHFLVERKDGKKLAWLKT